jgi:ribosome-associated protein
MAEEIQIRGQTIRLGQLLKLAGVVDSGSEVKALLGADPALVNGEPETRRGRQLHPGDTVRVGGHELRLIAAPGG